MRSGQGGATRRSWLLRLCTEAWCGQRVPPAWHSQIVALIHKKGNPADCGNYRPICLLNAAYKIFAMIILKRLLKAGANEKIWSSQFGFRPCRSTENALHVARRAIEQTWAHRNAKMHMLAVDWRKAFDSINPAALLDALRRFGLPAHVLRVVGSIYIDRIFRVKDCGETSDSRNQNSGICQGCPLSPFLFIIVMSFLMGDARKLLSPAAQQAIDSGSLRDLLYADDTIVIGESAELVAEYGRAIETAGATYGMSLHWGKTQALSICTHDCIQQLDGTLIEEKGSIEYLGALLSADGRVDSEISRRIGTATGDFRRLQKLWNHASVAVADKPYYFRTLILSRLQYGLSTICLVTAQRRRLDGFYARCLRKIMRIPSAYISRVSNAIVLDRAGEQPFSHQLLRRQLLLLGKISLAPTGSPLRDSTFIPGTLLPQVGRFVRRVGRPGRIGARR